MATSPPHAGGPRPPARPPARPGPRRSADRRPAIRPDAIVDAAVALTAESGIEGWTIRDLTARLDSWPQVVYHHIGSREAVVHEVVERVVALFPVPAPGLHWRDWFRDLLLGIRPVLTAHRGVARRLALYGPTVPSALPIIDRGVRLLHAGGLGDEATAAYGVLFNSALMPLALEDDRVRLDAHPDDRDLLLMVRDGDRCPGPDDCDGTGLCLFAGSLDRLNSSDEARAAFTEQFYAYTIDRALDGVQARIEQSGAAG
ncbi:regulatory protein, tetR family [Actinomadura madurae]|uniref:Regulatory protein, tetR family n=1 Tax=Actinomadura madurae TaxID=1993 RepID=A0A1I5PAT8_9ACTN|nr:TetR/AcrR family transcriptional regulator C-terminal domain-containing protein [Actinomadura madurae]SFP31037.1 regulatory protein, tetR family [Actinomadura madurae]